MNSFFIKAWEDNNRNIYYAFTNKHFVKWKTKKNMHYFLEFYSSVKIREYKNIFKMTSRPLKTFKRAFLKRDLCNGICATRSNFSHILWIQIEIEISFQKQFQAILMKISQVKYARSYKLLILKWLCIFYLSFFISHFFTLTF